MDRACKMFRKNKIFMSTCFCIIAVLIFQFIKFFSFLNMNRKNHEAFVIAKYHLKEGDPLNFENTTLVFLDLGKASSQFVRNSEFSEFEGLSVAHEVDANLPILKKNLIIFENIQNKIPAGKRLFILDVPLGAIASVLKPNSFVDVIAQIEMPGLGHVTETILEAVQIVSIGNESERADSNETEFLSFYLTPDEVKILSFMKPYSTFSVVMRNPRDVLKIKQNPMTFNHFVENEKIKKIIETDSFRIINGRKLVK